MAEGERVNAKGKTCTKCGTWKPYAEYGRKSLAKDGYQSHCRECDRAATRKWWRENPDKAAAKTKRYAERYPEKVAAQKILASAVVCKRVQKPNVCEGCGARLPRSRIHGHHHDYSKPLDVEWLCSPCHVARHPKPDNGIRLSPAQKQAVEWLAEAPGARINARSALRHGTAWINLQTADALEQRGFVQIHRSAISLTAKGEALLDQHKKEGR